MSNGWIRCPVCGEIVGFEHWKAHLKHHIEKGEVGRLGP